MNIKIKLRNSKYCSGCPVLFINYANALDGITRYLDCRFHYTNGLAQGYPFDENLIRPQKCIKENGVK